MIQLKLWYHTKMWRFYGESLDILMDSPEDDEYLDCYKKYNRHENKVRELKGA